MDIKVECISLPIDSRCDTCLSRDRMLFSLDEYMDVFTNVIGQCYDKIANYSLLQICWECRAMLHNIVKFQNRVKLASQYLKEFEHHKSQDKFEPLSTLRKKYTDSYDATYIYENDLKQEYVKEENNINSKKKNIYQNNSTVNNLTEFYPLQTNNELYYSSDLTVNQYLQVNNGFQVNNGLHVNNKLQVNNILQENNDEIYSSNDDLPLAVNKQEKRKSKPLKINKKPKKYKIINKEIDTKKIISKISINEMEMLECMKRERDSEFYQKKRHKCETCIIGFNSKRLLHKHNYEYHEKTLGDHICSLCHCRFENPSKLNLHIKEHRYKYICNVCLYVGYNVAHIKWHLYEKHKKMLICSECGLSFNTRSSVVEHYRSMHETFICDYCGITKRYKNSIEKHIRCHHSNLECKECGRKYSRLKYLQAHVRKRHSDQKSEDKYCVECDKTFKDAYAYQIHIKETIKHSGRKLSFPCPLCDKVFSRKTYLNKHNDFIHLHILKYKCEHCDKSFSRRDHLVRHSQLVHERREKPRNKICYICGRGFTNNMVLNNHIRTHTGERPFACSSCGARFAQLAALAEHRRRVHKHTRDLYSAHHPSIHPSAH